MTQLVSHEADEVTAAVTRELRRYAANVEFLAQLRFNGTSAPEHLWKQEAERYLADLAHLTSLHRYNVDGNQWHYPAGAPAPVMPQPASGDSAHKALFSSEPAPSGREPVITISAQAANQTVAGTVAGRLRLKPFIEELAGAGTDELVEVGLYARGEPLIALPTEPGDSQRFVMARPLQVQNLQWELAFSPGEVLLSREQASAWLLPALLLLGGFTIAGLVYLLRQLLRQQADLAETRAALVTETRQRRSVESDLQRMASIDELTGIPNRSFFIENLAHSLQVSARQHHQLALVVLDLDRFQVLNDSLGHGFGDQLLVQVAGRLSQLACPEVMIAHSSGDEFLLFLEQVESFEDAIELVTQIQQCLEPSFRIDGQSHKITGSMGVAVFPEGGDNAEALLRNADAALFQAKESGRNSFQFYAEGMHQRALDRLQLEKDLHLALERDEFVLYMQPQLNLANGRQDSVEALIRWHHPTRGLVPPLDFIPAAEESGLIVPIGRWVLESACQHLKRWRGTELDHMSIAINLSGRELASPDLLDAVSGMLTRYGVDPARLKMELTEEIFIDNIEHNMSQLLRLDQLGLQLAIDDFGVGYSSLAYLRNFPVSLVKIDRSFIANVVERPDDAVIVRAVINLAHNLGIPVVAEGIETQAQLDFLRANQCDLIQGYLIGRPMPAEALASHLTKDRRPAAAEETSAAGSGLLL